MDRLENNENGKYTYNISIHNVDNNVTTTINGTTLSYMLKLIKGLDSKVKNNAKQGNIVKGSHKASKTIKKK